MSTVRFDSAEAYARFRRMQNPSMIVASHDPIDRPWDYCHDAYRIASGAAQMLIAKEGSSARIGCISGDDFHATNQPAFSDVGAQFVSDCQLRFGSLFGAGPPDLIVLVGPEPTRRFLHFSRIVTGFAVEYGISRVLELTARLSTRELAVPLIHQPQGPSFSVVANHFLDPQPKPASDPYVGPAPGLAPLLRMVEHRGSNLELQCLEVELPAAYPRAQAPLLSGQLVWRLQQLYDDESNDESESPCLYRSGAT